MHYPLYQIKDKGEFRAEKIESEISTLNDRNASGDGHIFRLISKLSV